MVSAQRSWTRFTGVSVQVTTLPRLRKSASVRTSCGTFLLYSAPLPSLPARALPIRRRALSSCLQETVLLLCYRSCMAVRKKRSISLPPDLDAEIAAAAEHAGMTYSSWLAATARKEFTIRAGLAAVAQFEDEHGAFTPGELADADQWAAEATERASHSGTSTRRRSA